MTTKKKTTPSRPRKETVAQPEAVAEPDYATHPDDPSTPYYDARDDRGEFAVEPPVDPPTTPTAPVVDPVASKGYCDNHPDRPAVFVTNFAWSQPQRFCARCVPAQYIPLMQ